MRKLVGLFAIAAIVVAACGGTSTTHAPASVPHRPRPGRERQPRRPKRRRSRQPQGDQPVWHGLRARRAAAGAARSSSATGRKPRSSTPTTSVRSPRPTSPRLVWHTLLTISDDFKYVPQLAAEPIPTTENGGVKLPGDNGDAMTVTWKLRDGLKWSDGQPLTCDDFKYA